MPRGATRRGLPPAAGVPAAADRRFRRSDVRQGARRSWRRFAVRAALGVAFLLVLAVAAVWTFNAITNAEIFRIDRITVHGNRKLSTDEVRALIAGVEGQSVFHVDLEESRQRVLESAWVADAVLWRVFPSGVEIRISERTPLAIARLNRRLYLVDGTGVIIDAAGPEYSEFDLPVVDGLLPADGGSADPDRINLVARLMAALAPREDLLKRLSQINVSNPHDAVVLLEGEPARLHLGDQDFLVALERYEDAVKAVRERFDTVDYYDLRFERPVVGSITRARAPGR